MIEIYVPLPKDLLSEGNKQDHWALKYKRNRRLEKWLKALWRVENSLIKLPVNVSLTRVAPTPLDEDNWVTTGKHMRDWIANKIIPGLAPGRADGDNRITWHYLQKKGAVREYGLIIKIWN